MVTSVFMHFDMLPIRTFENEYDLAILRAAYFNL